MKVVAQACEHSQAEGHTSTIPDASVLPCPAVAVPRCVHVLPVLMEVHGPAALPHRFTGMKQTRGQAVIYGC